MCPKAGFWTRSARFETHANRAPQQRGFFVLSVAYQYRIPEEPRMAGCLEGCGQHDLGISEQILVC